MDKSVLHSDKNLIITLIVEETDDARLTIQSTRNGPTLTHRDDVVVVIDGQARVVEIEDQTHARVDLGKWAELNAEGFDLMIRIGEFFSGWEFDAEEEA